MRLDNQDAGNALFTVPQCGFCRSDMGQGQEEQAAAEWNVDYGLWRLFDSAAE
jgi:hypothetical protein